MKFISLISLALLLPSCKLQADYLIITGQKDLIPEGIAIDNETGNIYLSSIHHKKITVTDTNSGETTDFIQSGEHGYLSGVGILIKNQKLFALGGERSDGKAHSALWVFDLDSKRLLHKFEPHDTTSHFLNDLAMSDDQQIYLTDTENHRVYRLVYPDGRIELFIENDQIQYPNGIDISEDGRRLFVDSWATGIRIIDRATGKIINEPNEATARTGIDGLKYYGGNLYAIRNGGNQKGEHGLIRIELTDDLSAIGSIEPLLINHPLMNVPTTLDIYNGVIHLIANSQMENLDQETNTIIEEKELTNTYILRHQL